VVEGGVQLVPLVQDLCQAHVRHAQMGWLAALTGRAQRVPVGRLCRTQVALGALRLAQVVADAHGQKASEKPGAALDLAEDLRGLAACPADRFAGRPQLGEDLCQAALGWPQPAAQPLPPRLAPTHEGAHQPVVLAQLGQGLPVVAGREGGITAQPRERGPQERDPRGDIGQHARRPPGRVVIWFVAADRKGALGVIEQGLERFHLEALGGTVCLGQPQARPVAYRLRWQRRKPAAQGHALAAAQQRLDVSLHQPRRPGCLLSGQRVPHRVVGQVMLLAPGGRGPVQFRYSTRLFGLQPGAQQVGEQVVVAPPAAHLIQRHHKQARPLELLQHGLAVGPAGDRITQRPGQPVQQRGFQQERTHLSGLAVQGLIAQVVQHESVAAAERRREPGRIRVPA
jgi:hypothetical protein